MKLHLPSQASIKALMILRREIKAKAAWIKRHTLAPVDQGGPEHIALHEIEKRITEATTLVTETCMADDRALLPLPQLTDDQILDIRRRSWKQEERPWEVDAVDYARHIIAAYEGAKARLK